MSSTIVQTTNRTRVTNAQKINIRLEKLNARVQDFQDVLKGYASFVVVVSFVLTPLAALAFMFLYFGIIHGIMFVSTVVFINYLERKYHPVGVVGRRWQPFNDWLGKLWEPFAKMMPIHVHKLGKEEDYNANNKYMFCFHPHGILFLGPTTLACSWKKYFPNVEVSHLMSDMIFVAPALRQFCMWIGGIPVTRESATQAVNKLNHSLSVIPGGLAEMMQADATPRKLEKYEVESARVCGDENKCCGANVSFADQEKSTLVLYLKNRKGFIKLAIQLGLDLVPVLSLGEIENWNQMRTGLKWRMKVSRMLKMPLTCIWGKFLILPYRHPIHVLVSEPIKVEKDENPSQEKIDALHKQYLDHLCTMFEDNKNKYGYGDSRLVIM